MATVNELARRGHRVTVLTADLDTFRIAVGGDETLVSRVHPDVRIVRVPMVQDLRDPLINRWPGERAHDQRGWARRMAEHQMIAFPEAIYSPWGPRARAVALALHEREPIDLVIATGNPYIDFTVAFALHAEHGVPFVLDDRDSWLLDVYTGELSPDADRIRPWLNLALDVAQELWFVNPPIADWHRQEFPEHAGKIKVVENGWDSAFLDPTPPSPPASEKLVFSYIGTINSRLPLDLIGTSWREARSRSALVAASELRMVGHFGHAGGMTAEQSRVRSEYAPDRMVFPGRYPKDRIGEAYGVSDVLVFAKEGSALVTSGKIYEYVATGLPIVSILDRSHDARRVLEGYPRLHDGDVHQASSVADAMIQAAEDAVGQLASVPEAFAHGAQYRRDLVLAQAIDGLEARLGL